MDNARPLLIVVAGLAAAAVTLIAVYLTTDPPAERIVLSTGTPGGTYAAFGAVMAGVLGEAGAVRLETVPSAGAGENAARLARAEADAAFIQSDTAVAEDVSIAARLFPEAFHLIVRDDAGIARVPDLSGKRIALPPVGAGSNALFETLIAHYGLSADSVVPVRGTLLEGSAALARGEVDALFMVVALGNPSIKRLVAEAPVSLLDIDQAEAIALFDPALRAADVPVGVYSGARPVPDRPIRVVVADSLLAVRAGLSDHAVEALTRGLFEQRQQMVRQIPQAAFVAAPTDQDRLVFGVHPGAELYYTQDEPLFIVEYAEPMAFGVTALALLLSGLWQVRIWLAGARKNRADHYNLEIVALLNRVETASLPEDFAAIRNELFEIFEKVIVDLDNDRIEERSLLSFSFAWQVAASALNSRQLLMAGRHEAAAMRPVADDDDGFRYESVGPARFARGGERPGEDGS